jgi:hypothetical protein
MVMAVAFVGCSANTATIRRTNGPSYEARIVGSDPWSLHLLGDDGVLYAVPRSQVAEVDHPGNVLLMFGLASLAGSVALLAEGLHQPQGVMQRESDLGAAAVYGGLAVLLGGGGAWLWTRSKRAARTFETAQAQDYTPPPDAALVPPTPPRGPPPALAKAPVAASSASAEGQPPRPARNTTSGLALTAGYGYQFAFQGVGAMYYLRLSSRRPVLLAPWAGFGADYGPDHFALGGAGGLTASYGVRDRMTLDLGAGVGGVESLGLHGTRVDTRRLLGYFAAGGYERVAEGGAMFRGLIGAAYRPEALLKDRLELSALLAIGWKLW